MRSRIFFSVCAVAAILAAACTSNNSVTLPPPGSSPTPTVQHVYVSDDTGVIYAFAYPLTSTSTSTLALSVGFTPAGMAAFGNKLYVANDGGSQALVYQLPLTSTSTSIATITLSHHAVDVALDSSGNLYAAENQSSTCCVDFVPAGASSPSFTLSSANVITPFGATLDRNNNLFLANSGNVGFFAAPVTSSSTGISFGRDSFNEGLVTDSSGNLYVADGNGPGTIDIYNPPYTSASMPVSTSTIGGTLEQMAMDANNVLYTNSFTPNQIDVLNAPYTSIAFFVPVATHPYGIALGP